jgi:chaperonin GroES
MPFDSVADRVILKIKHEDVVTSSGFVLPKHLQPLPDRAEVVAVGIGTYDNKGVLHPLPVSVGDIVIFSHGAAYGVELDGEDYVTVPISGILAIIEE